MKRRAYMTGHDPAAITNAAAIFGSTGLTVSPARRSAGTSVHIIGGFGFAGINGANSTGTMGGAGM